MFRILALVLGVLFLAVGVMWFATALLDAPLASVAASFAKPGAAKLALDNVLSIVVAVLSLVGLALLAWGVVWAGRSAKAEATA